MDLSMHPDYLRQAAKRKHKPLEDSAIATDQVFPPDM